MNSNINVTVGDGGRRTIDGLQNPNHLIKIVPGYLLHPPVRAGKPLHVSFESWCLWHCRHSTPMTICLSHLLTRMWECYLLSHSRTLNKIYHVFSCIVSITAIWETIISCLFQKMFEIQWKVLKAFVKYSFNSPSHTNPSASAFSSARKRPDTN